MPTSEQPRLSSIRIYPIKSCHAVTVEECEVNELGPANDRTFMIIDKATNRFITQRKYACMALLQPLVDTKKGTLTLTCGDMPALELPLNPPKTAENKREVTIWKDSVVAYDLGDEAADWLDNFFKKHVQHNRENPHAYDGETVDAEVPPCRLVTLNSPVSGGDYSRPAHAKLPGVHAPFSDSSPISIGTESSLEDVNNGLKETGISNGKTITVDRFRNNLTISGTVPWEEDEWLVVQIGEVTFYVMRPIARCPMPGFDQDTGIKDNWGVSGVLEYLKIKRNLSADPKQGYFCVDAAPLTKGTIRVGDPVKVLERIPADKVERVVGKMP
ncbi:MOSC N-terminal beta barrel domain-containing protein [Dichotomocladium elegans]|nr:MOSC N-terminal beta barrel domain-containing protein [Dichotomocladium elegans]